MTETYNPDSEVITSAEVLYLFALLVSYKDGYRCVFDISDRVTDHIIHQPFRDNPLFFYDFVIKEYGAAIEWNIEYAADNIREFSVPIGDILKYIKEQCRNRITVASDKSDPFAKEKARNRRKTQKLTLFLSDPLGQFLTKAILKTEALAPFVLKLTYKDGFKCIFDLNEWLSTVSPHPHIQAFTDATDIKLDPWGTNLICGSFEISAERLREYSVPLDLVAQWCRDETRKIKDSIQTTYRSEATPRNPPGDKRN
ncbi:MAG: hypothetical protein IJ165_05340 [Proteobacteria bacterium]|nr:hypothetical protein [Pseudomonadota bacterium]